MQRVIFAILALAIVAFAQSPQTPGALTPLVSGTTVSGILPPTTQANNYHVDLYSFYVPENTTSVNFTFANTNYADCSYIHMFVRTSGLPCSYHDFSTSYYLCANSWDPGNGISGTSSLLSYPGYNSDLYEFSVNNFLYIGMGRYGLYNTYTCTYSLTVSINSSCPTGSVALYYSSSATTCSAPYTTITAPQTVTLTTGVNANYEQVYKLSLPQGVGHVYLQLNSTSSSSEFYGMNYAAPSYSYNNCYRTSYTYVDTYGFYIYQLFCYTPRAGDFWVAHADDGSSGFNATFSFEVVTCPSGMGGFNCSFPATALNFTQLGSGFTATIPYSSTGDYLTYGWAYYFVDIPGNFTGNTVQLTATATTGSGYMEIRKDGYPEDSSTYGYEDSAEYDSFPAQFIMNQFDWAVAGRWYIGLECTSSPSCTVVLAANSTQTTSSSSGAVTTGVAPGPITTATTLPKITTGLHVTGGAATSNTGNTGVTTGSEDSAAGIVIPSFALAMIAYFLF
jgi:hypothetical protein